MKGQRTLMVVLTLALTLVLAVGLSQAEGPETPKNTAGVERETSTAVVGALIPIQGKLTDASGGPINGSRSITFKLYDVASGGTALCSDTHTVSVDKGLFSTSMANCSDEDINGRQLYLGIQVSGDPEMLPRQPIYAVPYAWSLRPSANISGTTSEAIIHAENWHTSGRGLRAYAMATSGTNYGVVGASKSPDGYGGYFYNNDGGTGLWAKSNGTGSSVIASNDGTGDLFKGFGGDGGEDEFRVNNNGSIESKADSYVFVPGTEATINGTSTGVALEYYGMGNVQVDPSTTGEKIIQFGAVLPSVLYGQPVQLEQVTVFYETSNSSSYINRTQVFRQKASDPIAYYTLVDDTTNRNSTTYTNYSVTPTSSNTLSVSEGFVSVELRLYFADAAHFVTIGGIRLRLGHHHLY